jgi:predicted acetyltransferase
MTADLTIDTRRAGWSGPAASGRLHFVPVEQLREDGRAILERVRLLTPGEIELDAYLWERQLGLVGDDGDQAKHLRAVRYDDAAGVPQGFAVYRVVESAADFARRQATVQYFAAATDEAYAGLWRYLLELDLIGTVTAPLRSVDEPVVWQLADFRAARKSNERDHLWLRILDVTAALEARRYSAPGRIVLEVADPLGFADAPVLVSIDASGTATVTPLTGAAPDDAAALSLTVNELAALYLGGTSARSLVRSGRITELRPGSADAVDSSFRSPVTPWLSVWF